jgi:diguanylate cyclase (GGDEF)-like protein
MLRLRPARNQALLTSVALLALVVSVAALATWRDQHAKEAARSIGHYSAVVAALDDARAQTFFTAAQIASSTLSGNTSPVADLYPQVAAAIDGDMQVAETGLSAMGEVDAVAALKSVDSEMDQLMQDPDVVSLVSLNSADKTGAGRQYYSRIWPGVESAMAELQQLADGERGKLAAEQATASRLSDHTFGLLIGLSLLAFLGGAAMLLRLVPLLVRPLATRDLNKMASQRIRVEQALKLQAATDRLTGLRSHRSLHEELAKEVERSLRYNRPVTIMMMDIDGFRLFNDTYGYQEGDRVLKQVAKVLERESRSNDIVGRYGGDEFMAILPETGRDEGVSSANRLFEALSHERVQPRLGKSVPLVLSVGIAVCPGDSRHREELIAYADASLTEAKQVSGNALVVAQREPGEIITRERSPFGILDALVRAVDRKDRYTRRHSQQNAEFAVELGKRMGLTEGVVSALRIAGLLHDVGKIGVPDDILKKPGPLSDEERALMREHVVLSNLIVHGIPNLEDVSDAVYCHHERWDGMGYPRGLKGEEVPLPGRIMALVDAYSAMILDRPYRKALTGEEAAAELRRNSGTQFDPELVEPFIQLLESSEAAAA